MTEVRIGFIGLGNMGGRITKTLIRSGADVLGYDPVTENIHSAGARAAASGGEVAAESDVVLLSLPESKIVEHVVFGDGGVLDNARAGQVIVDLSTSDPASTRAIAKRLKTETGAAYVDAGISGGAAAAEKGTLTLMVGGDRVAFEVAQPVLDRFATRIYFMGSSGSGHVAKLLNNFLNATNLTATAEVMVAGRKAGLDLAVLLDVINNSSGANWASINRFPHIINGDYLEGGLTSDLMMKDVLLYVQYAASLGIASPNSSAPLAAFGLAERLGYGKSISNRVVDAIGDLSGGVRLHSPFDAEVGGE